MQCVVLPPPEQRIRSLYSLSKPESTGVAKLRDIKLKYEIRNLFLQSKCIQTTANDPLSDYDNNYKG